MQHCPYIHEMKERLLSQGSNPEQLLLDTMDKDILEIHGDSAVGTVVKCNPDGYGSHTSPTHCSQKQPLIGGEPTHYYHDDYTPKNAKTSLFIIMSFIYAKLLVVVCIAYVISEVVTHNLPLHYYEGFFTYLYGTSILFLLYVFCFLLQESTCCNSPPDKPKKPKVKEVKKKKEKEKKEDKKKEDKKKGAAEKPSTAPPPPPPAPDAGAGGKPGQQPQGPGFQSKICLQKEVYPRKMKDRLVKLQSPRANQPAHPSDPTESVPIESGTGSDTDLEGVLRTLRTGKDVNLNEGESPSQEKLTGGDSDVEASGGRQWKRKTSQNIYSHGSFFLRVGAIGFGVCTMIYNGLECGQFFEIPFTSPCYQILRGINPVLQMIFTFMQMYFIFMNSRLNIHRFKVVARFGLMHIVSTNLCVWIRTLVLESLKEIKAYHHRKLGEVLSSTEDFNVLDYMRVSPGGLTHEVRATSLPSTLTSTLASTSTMATAAPTIRSLYGKVAKSTARNIVRFTTSTVKSTLSAVASTVTTEPTTTTTTTTTLAPTTAAAFNVYRSHYDAQDNSNKVSNFTSVLYNAPMLPAAAALTQSFGNSSGAIVNAVEESCGRTNIMGTIVEDSAPYLFPCIIEYSLIGAAVMFVMWKQIGHHPRYVSEEDLERRLEMMLSRRAVAMARAQHGRVDCVGASKGLFFGLLLLVGSLICLILFFVLIQHPKLGLVAIYLADVSHCVVMMLSIFAIILGFIRVQSLKFKAEEQSDLNDILLRVSAFGLFIYAVFSIISGSMAALTKEPNLLVMITGILSVLQVILQLLFIADVSRRRVHLPEHDRSKPGRQVVTFLLICNVTMWVIYTFEMQKVLANPVQLDFYGFLAWAIVQRVTLPLCIFHRFHSAVTLAEIWKTSYKARLE